MSASERAKKKRVRSALFPHQSAAARTRYAGRKRDAKWQRREDSDAEDDWQCQITDDTDYVRQNLLCSSSVKRGFARVWNGWLVWWNELLQQIV